MFLGLLGWLENILENVQAQIYLIRQLPLQLEKDYFVMKINFGISNTALLRKKCKNSAMLKIPLHA